MLRSWLLLRRIQHNLQVYVDVTIHMYPAVAGANQHVPNRANRGDSLRRTITPQRHHDGVAETRCIKDIPRFGALLRRSITTITYTGRRSGRTFNIPVAYRRRGDEIDIVANMPDAKTWWRNFLGDGAPMSLTLDRIERSGHAVAHRDENGRVTVRVRLAPQ